VERSSRAVGAARGRRWIWGLAFGTLLLGSIVAALLIAPKLILQHIVQEAARRGLRLSGCSLELDFGRALLRGCNVSTAAVPNVVPPFAGVTIEGHLPEIDILIQGLEPRRVVVRRMALEASGFPIDKEVLRADGSGRAPLPIEVEAGTVTWRSRDLENTLLLTEVAYASETESLSASWEWPGRARGRLSWRPSEIELTFGDTAPSARLVVRPIRPEQRLELRLELRGFPLAVLDGPAFRLTQTLRPIRVDGHVSVSFPTGLDMELARGDFYLTLSGLQFPVPREVEGLVHASPPKISGKLSFSRSFNRASVSDLGFLTGQLQMSGRAELAMDPQLRGLHFEAHMSGPLSCRAIAESAVTAHAGSALGKLAGRLGRNVLSGSVEIIAALAGDTWQLDRASVLTSVGVGCGVRPLPVDLSAAAEALSRLPAEVLEKLPRLPALPPGLTLPERWRQPLQSPPAAPATPRGN
jgi:hypothetical protein